MQQYEINKIKKETIGQIKKHISQLSESDVKAIKKKLNAVNINNIHISQHAFNHVKLDYKDIKKCFSSYDIIEFNITHYNDTPKYRVLIRSKDCISTVCDNKLIKVQICIVYDMTENIVISIYLNDKNDKHNTLNQNRYDYKINVDVGKLLC